MEDRIALFKFIRKVFAWFSVALVLFGVYVSFYMCFMLVGYIPTNHMWMFIYAVILVIVVDILCVVRLDGMFIEKFGGDLKDME